MKDVKVLTEGAIMAALMTLIAFISFTVPLIGSILILAIPIPLVVYTTRHGSKPGIMLWVVANLVSLIIGGPTLVLGTVLFGGTGIVIGELILRRKSAFIVLFGGSLANISALILSFIFSIVVLDIHPMKMIQETMKDSIQTAEKMLIAIGQEPGNQYDPILTMIDQLNYITPALIIITGVVYAILVQLLSVSVLRRIGVTAPKFKPFHEWSFPKSFLWYYLIVSILFVIGFDEGTLLFTIIFNLTPILEMIITIQGLAVVFYYFHIKRVNKAVVVVIVVLSILLPPILLIYRILGIIDLGFELRKRIKNSEK